jgi:hypothetical protein
MAIHTASPRRPFSNPLRKNFRVLLDLPVWRRDSPHCHKLGHKSRSGVSAERRQLSIPKKTAETAQNIPDLPAFKPLAGQAVQKGPQFRIIPHNSTSFRLLPPWGGGYQMSIFIQHPLLCVALCRLMSAEISQPATVSMVQCFTRHHSTTPPLPRRPTPTNFIPARA